MKPYLLTTATFLGLTASGLPARAQVQFNFTYTGKLDNFTAPIAGTYRILVFGAQGGNGTPPVSAGTGGLGAEIGGDFDLTNSEALTIAVGGAGLSGMASTAGGGGGGSFVVGPTPLVIAGGGGGGGVAGVSVAPGELHGGNGGVGPNGGSVPPNQGDQR
jgi:Glycine rich protein